MKYVVKLEFVYSDIVHVEADNKDDAEAFALEACEENFGYYLNCDVQEED